MYYLLTYDIASPKRLPKALKVCRQFLHHAQNSVFEGELTEKQKDELVSCLSEIINEEEDAVVIYSVRDISLLKREVMGIEKNAITYIL